MNIIARTAVLIGLVLVPICLAEAKCCGRRTVVRTVRSCGGGNVRIIGGGCKKYSWVGDVPAWKRLPDDCSQFEKHEYERFSRAFALIPEKIRKQAKKNFKQRMEYLKRPNAARDRAVFAAKLAKRSKFQRNNLSDEYALKMYDEMLVYGRSLIFGHMGYEIGWLAEEYGFTNVAKFINKVETTSEKKGRNLEYPMNNPEFKAFAELAKQASYNAWNDFNRRIRQMNSIYADKMALQNGRTATHRNGKRL